MDKAQIKKFSQYARSTLIPEMEQAISSWKNANIVSWWVQIWNHSYNDSLSLKYSSAVTSLKKQIDKKWEKALAEEAAYIWFNRIVALRFMEVNKYLPTRSSLFASDDDTWIPEIVKNIDSERNNCGCDKNAIDQYIWKYDTQSIQELYGLILVSICNKLSEHYWFMFSKIDDWTALLFPRTILNASHILRDNTNGMLNIADKDWKEVEIIGWIYQYYISERKAELDSSNDKLQNSEEIAASTQLFTPEWIVKYIVHNTVGKLDNLELSHKIKTENNFDYDVSDLSKFKVLDPASWSGHILVRAYDVLKEVYLQRWHDIDDIPAMILKDNLYWFDIDERAHQLACFAILMKAKADDKNIEKKVDITKNIICIKENNKFEDVDEKRYPLVRSFLKIWYNASMYGSLIRIPSDIDIEKTKNEFGKFQKENWLIADSICSQNEFELLIHQTELLDNLYDCVVANPPYKWWDKLDDVYKKYLLLNYPDEKWDLFSVFIVRCLQFCVNNWFVGMVTMHARMFLVTYEKLRDKLISSVFFDSLVHHWPHGFPEISWEIVQTCSFVFKNQNNVNWLWKYLDLRSQKNAELKEKYLIDACNNDSFITKDQNNFRFLPWFPFSYWVSDNLVNCFKNKSFLDYFEVRKWADTWDNAKYLRERYEVSYSNIKFKANPGSTFSEKWVPYNKWWEFRKRYWNNDLIVNWWNDGYELKHSKANLRSPHLYFKDWITWTATTSSCCFRLSDYWAIFDSSWSSMFPDDSIIYYILWLSNSKIINIFRNILNPTLSYWAWTVSKFPCIIDYNKKDIVQNYVENNIIISKEDRDSFETSRNFKYHPFIKHKSLNKIESSYANWINECSERFQKVKDNEEELNRIFNKIYGLEWEVDPTVEDKDVSIEIAFRDRDIRSLLSYMVWCMMWRYSLDQEWLVYAWWDFDKSKYKTFKADDDGIIPILDRDYSDDDIVERTKEFVKKVWWDNTLDENINWIAESLDPESNKTADQVIRDYYNKEFYDNHCQIYQKRPIYWLFVSNPAKPKDSAFKALVYMHRYSASTIQDLRRNYVQMYQQKLLEERARIENNNDKASQKRVAEIDKINTELTAYANKLKDFAVTHQWTIDLDDWVKVNYWMFMDADIVAKIKL